MMFDRHKASFDWSKASQEKLDRPEGSGAPEPDLPFDVQLKRQLLGDQGEANDAPQPRPFKEREPLTEFPGVMPEILDPAPEDDAGTGREMLALGSWETLSPAWRGHQETARKLRDRSDEVRQTIDALRTQVLQKLKAEGWRRVAVCAPTSDCGTTFTALNLALSMAAIPDVRTVLLDLNQRAPGLAGALDVKPVHNASDLLQQRLSYLDYLQRYGDNLVVGLNADVPHNPAEILQSRTAANVLNDMTQALNPDVVLFDMPPMLEYDDLSAFLPQVDAVLIVADGTKTLGRQIAKCERLLDGRAPLMGVVLNRGRVSAKKAAIW